MSPNQAVFSTFIYQFSLKSISLGPLYTLSCFISNFLSLLLEGVFFISPTTIGRIKKNCVYDLSRMFMILENLEGINFHKSPDNYDFARIVNFYLANLCANKVLLPAKLCTNKVVLNCHGTSGLERLLQIVPYDSSILMQ